MTELEKTVAEMLMRNLLGRIKPVEAHFELPGGILSLQEITALKIVLGQQEEQVNLNAGNISADIHQSKKPIVSLVLDCLSAEENDAALLCIDFGTAFSKAAIWRRNSVVPTPLPLGHGSDPTSSGLLVDSAAYISDGKILFGPSAIDRYRREDDIERSLFASPKELLTHDVSRLDIDRPQRSVDPTGLLSSRDLLTLYLGYLTAIVCQVLPTDIPRTVKRRYAAPGWNNAQAHMSGSEMGLAARSLGDFLVDAQILADTIDISEWRDGLLVSRAAAIMLAIRGNREDRSDKNIRFVERAVLEAVAAGSGIQDRFKNKRPQVLIVDVGAGTTDIGAFKFVLPGRGEAVVAPYRDGMRAVQMAGNLVDDALIELATAKIKLPSDSFASRMFKRRLRNVISDRKSHLCSAGSTIIDILDAPPVSIELPELVDTPAVANFVIKFKAAVTSALDSTGASFRGFENENVVVFSGGGSMLPFLRDIFSKPLQTQSGLVGFRVDDAVPSWVENAPPEVETLYPQLAVSTGGCSPHLPTERQVVGDTGRPAPIVLGPVYR